LRRGHEREHNAGGEHGPDQDPGDGEPRPLHLLAQRCGLLEAREGEQAERQPERDRRGADAGCRDEQFAQWRVGLRAVPLRDQHQHRAGHQQHGHDGNAFEHEQHQAGAPRGNDAKRPDHHGGHQRQAEARGIAPEIEALQEIGAEQAGGANTHHGKAEIGPEQRPSGNQSRARAQDRRHEPIGRARIGMVARQSRKAPCHQQHDNGGQREDERDHAAHMVGRLLRVQVHRHRGSHPCDSDGNRVPGADALEQDGRRIDGRTIRHAVRLARAQLQVELTTRMARLTFVTARPAAGSPARR
jgi:hypothetical protein